jgi:proteasome lid subunit RPN8/RPN11
VRFGARAVCQLQRLKRISVAQPGFGRHGLGEVAAFVLGRRLGDGPEVDVTRVVVPPFRFSRDTLTFLPANLGALEPGEAFVGTYHTHPQGDLDEGMLSDVDLRFMRRGQADFAGAVGPLQGRHAGVDWLVDVVETRDGGWNVFAHDERRLFDLLDECDRSDKCPLEDLRTVGSRFYLLTRAFDESADSDDDGA